MLDMSSKAFEIAAELQRLHEAALPAIMNHGLQLMRKRPPKQLKLARLVFISLGQRLFLLLGDIQQSFRTQVESGYFTTAILTRALMEAATILLVLNKDTTGQMLRAYLEMGELEATKRRVGLVKMQRATNPDIAKAAQSETARAEDILKAL